MKNYPAGLALFFCFFMASIQGQNVGKVISMVRNGQVYVQFLLESKFYQEFNVSLYVSRDNGQTFEGPLTSVTGDVGKVKTKGIKTIIWDAMKEMPFVSETLVFDVRAEITRNRPRKSFYLMYVGNPTTYFGLRAGMLGRVGFYVELRGNMMARETEKYTYKDSLVNYNQPGYFNFTGSNGYSAMSGLVGINYQPGKNFFLYLGAGYGKEDYLMKIDEFSYEGDVKTGSSYVKYENYSNSGVEVNLGIMVRIKAVMLSAGGTMLNFKAFGGTAGVGVSF